MSLKTPEGCRICKHPQREEIEAAMKTGRSLRSVAKEYRVSRSTLSRHLGPDHAYGMLERVERSPLTPAPLKRDLKAIRNAAGLVAEMDSLIEVTNGILSDAMDSGDATLGLRAIESARQNLETLAKITGQLNSGGNTQINNGISPSEYNKTVSHVIRALEPFPDARNAVLAALEGFKVIECQTD